MSEKGFPKIGDILDDKYVIESFVGQGGMGSVYRARHIALDSSRAIKLMRRELAEDETFIRRFQNEARLAESLRHPNIVALFDYSQLPDGTVYIAWEFVEGRTLASILREGTRFTDSEVVQIIGQIADGLAAAHHRGIIHRDISPDNIMLCKDFKEKTTAKLLDFGLAKTAESASATPVTSGILIGKVGYSSPEQLGVGRPGCPVDVRTDVFSLGIVTYKMLTGENPFRVESFQTYLRDAVLAPEEEERQRFLKKLPDHWRPALGRALSRNCEDRTPSMEAFIEDIETAAKAGAGFEVPSEVAPGSKDSPTESAVGRRMSFSAIHWTWPLLILGIPLMLILGWRLWPTGPGPPQAPSGTSLAVLPFVNDTGDPELEYLSDGIADSLISHLSRVPNLKVISRASAFRYRSPDLDYRIVGQELDVGTIVVGWVNRQAEEFFVEVELLDAVGEHRIWAAHYRFDPSDLMRVDENIASQVSAQLRLRLTRETRELLARQHTTSAEAYRLHLQARYHLNKRTERDLRKAIELFEQAGAMDSNFALAHAGLADCYAILGSTEYGIMPPSKAIPYAKDYAIRALSSDRSLGEALATLGLIRWSFDWEWNEAEKNFTRAIELNPSYATAHQWYAEFLTSMGRYEEAESRMNRALELDPLSLPVRIDMGFHYYIRRDFENAIANLETALEMEPYFYPAHFYLGLTYLAQRRYTEALTELETATELSGRMSVCIATLAYAHAASGNRPQAEVILAELNERAARGYVPADYFAGIYAALGDRDEAFRWLEKAFQEGSGLLVFLKEIPLYDNLRTDPRFDDLLKKVGFPEQPINGRSAAAITSTPGRK